MKLSLRALVLAATAAFASAFTQQSPAAPGPPPNGAITGIVIDGVSGEAVAGALVFLGSSEPGWVVPTSQTRQVTDTRGRFAFVELPGEGRYSVSVTKFGYLDGGFGRDKSPTDPLRPIELGKDAWVSNLRVPIWRPGSISGAVRDESGEPVVGVFVRALARFRIQGKDGVVAGPMTLTNDRGEYRLSGLTPGRYFVQVPSVQASVPAATKFPSVAVPSHAPDGVINVDDTQRLVIGRYPLPPPSMNGRQMAYAITFHPSAAALDQAMVLDLKFGEERPNIDMTLAPVPTARISGIVDGPTDALVSLTLRLLPAGLENLGFGAEAATALVGADGRFTFVNVPAGNYTIDAPVKVAELTSVPPNFGGSGFGSRAPNRFPVPPPAQGSGYSSNSIELLPGVVIVDSSFRSGAGEYSGRVSVTLAATDVNNVVLRMRPHVTFTGRIVIETDPSKPDVKAPARIPLRLDPATGEASLGMPQSSIQQEGSADTFVITGVKPGQFFLRQSAFPAWVVRSISYRGRDFINAPFDTSAGEDFSGIVVTVTNAVPELSGAVRAGVDLKPESTMVVVFPADRANWTNTGLNPVRMKYGTVSSTNTYRFATLPAGDYLVAAIDRSHIQTWRDPEFLARLERVASRVTLSWGTRTNQDVTAVGIR